MLLMNKHNNRHEQECDTHRNMDGQLHVMAGDVTATPTYLARWSGHSDPDCYAEPNLPRYSLLVGSHKLVTCTCEEHYTI
ncbi:hypothetical protein J6590_048694 [Homalodisca vitripennis]|nr:hypothetical protein J6590_048694 [Homalodisca vitripennis]